MTVTYYRHSVNPPLPVIDASSTSPGLTHPLQGLPCPKIAEEREAHRMNSDDAARYCACSRLAFTHLYNVIEHGIAAARHTKKAGTQQPVIEARRVRVRPSHTTGMTPYTLECVVASSRGGARRVRRGDGVGSRARRSSLLGGFTGGLDPASLGAQRPAQRMYASPCRYRT